MPTTRPRYTVTDTGELRTMLDLAAARWPDVHDRRALLLRLVEAGRDAVAPSVGARARANVRDLQRAALGRAADLVDLEVLLGDEAWR